MKNKMSEFVIPWHLLAAGTFILVLICGAQMGVYKKVKQNTIKTAFQACTFEGWSNTADDGYGVRLNCGGVTYTTSDAAIMHYFAGTQKVPMQCEVHGDNSLTCMYHVK